MGSGAGLPGLPLAIALPRVRFVLVESSGRKCAFIDRAVAECGLENVEVVDARVEDMARRPLLASNWSRPGLWLHLRW